MIVRGRRPHLIAVLSQLPRELQSPRVHTWIATLDRLPDRIYSPDTVHIDIDDPKIAEAVVAGLVARTLS